MAMKFKDVLPFLLAGGAWYAWQSGMLNGWTGLKPAGVAPPVAGPAPPPSGGPVFGPAPTPAAPPVVTVALPPVAPPAVPLPMPVAAPPTAPPVYAGGGAQALIAAGGAAPKNIWEWGYYVRQLGLILPRRDPSILGATTADIQAVKFTAPEYLAYLQGGSLAGLRALACACVSRATRI